MSPRAHSKLGASTAKRWMNCPGSVALCETLPELPEGAAAREGTNAHAWAEYALANGEVSISDYVGTEAPAGGLVPLTKDMADAVNVYLEHVWFLLKPEDELHVERQFSLEFVAPGMFGTNDCCILKPDGTLHVIDYKHGAGLYVPAKYNDQLKYYALGALETFRATHKFTKVVCWIVQPRAGSDTIRDAEYDALEIWEFGLALRVAAAAAREENAPRHAGEWCRFCPGTTGACAEFKGRALATAADGLGEILPPAAVDKFDPAETARRFAQLPLLKIFIERFEDFARAEALEGRLPGFKFVEGRGRREWSKTDFDTLKEVHERTGKDIQRTEPMSPAQVEKLIGKKAFADLSDLITKKYPKPSLVPESDRRPALSIAEVKGISADGLEAIEHPE